jgi:hypothetical protein
MPARTEPRPPTHDVAANTAQSIIDCGVLLRLTTHGSLSKYALLSDAATASCLPSGLQASP